MVHDQRHRNAGRGHAGDNVALRRRVAFQLKPADGWGLELFSGIVTLLLGILLWRQFPLSGAWAIGILFGIKLIISSWAFVIIGRSVSKTALVENVT